MTEFSSTGQSNLKRYLFATILPIIFLSLSLSVLLYDQVQLYTFTKTEIEGVQMIRSLYNALTDLQKIRGYSQIIQYGQHNDINRQLNLLKKRFLDRFRRKKWLLATQIFQLRPEAEHLETKAKQLFKLTSFQAKEQHVFNRYSELITEIIQCMQLLADHSNLILDPEIDTYYLIDVLDVQIPYLAESIGRVRGIGSGLLAKKTVTVQERELLYNYQAAIKARIESIQNAQSVIVKTSADLNHSLHLLPETLDAVITPLFNECLLIEDKNNCPQLNPEQFFQLATSAIDLLATPYQTGIVLLTSKLKTRQTKHLRQGAFIFIGTTIAILLLLFFNRSFYLYDQKLHNEMKKLSLTDQLTGLYNRRHFYTVFPRELRKSSRHGEQLYLGLLDVDNFKHYNDTYGHPQGDQALQKMAVAMQNVLQRAGDYCFRIGGEEFCFLFNAKSIDNAKQAADRLRKAVEDLAIAHKGNSPHCVLTISIGLVQVPPDPNCILEQVMSKVDKALYMAKKRGRNQCVFPG